MLDLRLPRLSLHWILLWIKHHIHDFKIHFFEQIAAIFACATKCCSIEAFALLQSIFVCDVKNVFLFTNVIYYSCFWSMIYFIAWKKQFFLIVSISFLRIGSGVGGGVVDGVKIMVEKLKILIKGFRLWKNPY